MYTKRKIERGEILTHTYGSSKQLKYRKKNKEAITGEQEFTRRFGERYAFEISTAGGQSSSSAQTQPLTHLQCEVIRGLIRGNSDTREKVLAQCGIIIEIIKAKITSSYWNKLITYSETFRRGIANRCVLSVMEGIREAVSNPGGEDEVKADANREAAEKQRKEQGSVRTKGMWRLEIRSWCPRVSPRYVQTWSCSSLSSAVEQLVRRKARWRSCT
jgi:hypothetical protein